MEEDYDIIAQTNDDINVTASDNFENENITKHKFHEYHDYSYDDMPTKIHHLMYSDTLIVVISLIIMIIVGLVFRYVVHLKAQSHSLVCFHNYLHQIWWHCAFKFVNVTVSHTNNSSHNTFCYI